MGSGPGPGTSTVAGTSNFFFFFERGDEHLWVVDYVLSIMLSTLPALSCVIHITALQGKYYSL